MKALALFSGGLDSALAIKTIKDQGIEVIALNFVSYFFGGPNPKAEYMAKQLGVQLEYIDFKEIHREIVKNPPNGYGKNMNPCIDCHALMIKTAKELLPKYGADFIITGEVLGQRPMSQNSVALRRVEKLSGAVGLLLRPMSAKLLPETMVEKNGWVDREKLLDFEGRTRRRQMEMMEANKIKEYPMPGGGCLLTDPGYSKRLKLIKEDGQFEERALFGILKAGRMFRLEAGRYIFAGRDEEDNKKLWELKDNAAFCISTDTTSGPVILGYGNVAENDREFACRLFSKYSKVKGAADISVKLDGISTRVPAIDNAKTEEEMRQFLIV